ncbi:MAG: FHA domain-containing protein [Elusimicrobiota bacterium]
MPKLLLKFKAAVIKEIPIEKTSLSVGRKPDNDIVIDNPAISGHHCKVVLKGDTYYVEDLESTNGTYVNEKRIMKSGLHHNDVLGVGRHALVFIEDTPPEAQDAKGGDETMVLTPEKQREIAKSAMASAPEKEEKIGCLRVLKGVVSEPEFELKGLSTYIGKSDRVQIPIKGTGIFGGAPEVAASIHRKPEGYMLMAVRDGYPVVNGTSISGQVQLNDGDIIECGGTTLQFFIKEPGA